MGHVQTLIVFDLDGTLIDSRTDLADAANALVTERGGRPFPEEAIGRMVGEGAAVLVQRALAAAGLPLEPHSVTRFLELYDERLLKKTRPYEGVTDALRDLSRDGVLAVLTNKPAAPTRKLLDALGLAPFFASAVGGDGPFPKKPAPEALLHLIARHGSRADACVLVGDSRIDLETARAAGTAACMAGYGFGYETFDPSTLAETDRVVDSPSGIAAAVRQLLAPGAGRSNGSGR